jgi:hypothetical protein
MNIEKAALAWYILEDETYSGGDWEVGNAYWLTRKRTALALFKDGDDLRNHAKYYEKLVEAGALRSLTEDEENSYN